MSTITKFNKTTKKIWDRLMACFGDYYIVAGLMGHMYTLSELKPSLIKGYNEAADVLSMEDFVHGRGTYGICQWRKWTSKQGLWNMAREMKKPLGNLDIQLDFVWDELKENEYTDMMKKLKRSKRLQDVVNLLAEGYFYKNMTVRQTRVKEAYDHANDILLEYAGIAEKVDKSTKERVAKKAASMKLKKYLVANSSSTRVHTADSGASPEVGVLEPGKKYEYIMSNEGNKWHCIVFEGKLRWVYKNNTQVIDK